MSDACESIRGALMYSCKLWGKEFIRAVRLGEVGLIQLNLQSSQFLSNFMFPTGVLLQLFLILKLNRRRTKLIHYFDCCRS